MEDQSMQENMKRDIQPDLNGGSAGFNGNILREKTFNEDLRSILDKIKDHEKSTIPQRDTGESDLSGITAKELLLKYHSLFYRVKYFGDFCESNTSADVFGIDPSDMASANKGIIAMLRRNAEAIGFSSLSILRYCMEKKCFIPLYNGIDFIDNDNFVIGLSDRLFQEIQAAPWGLMLSRDELEESDYFRNKLSAQANGGITSLYFAGIDSITGENAGEMQVRDEHGEIPFYPSSILLLQAGTETEKQEIESIKRNVISRLSTALLLYDAFVPDRKSERGKSYCPYALLEELAHVSFHHEEGCCFSLYCMAYEFHYTFIIKYIAERMKITLPNDTVIARMNSRALIVFSTISRISLFEDMMDRYNDLFGGSIRIRIIRNSSLRHPHELVKELFLGF